MNNRICPPEEILSEYLAGVLRQEERPELEKHLAGCARCRRLLAEAYEIVNAPDFRQIKENIMTIIKNNHWFIGAAISFVLSFLFPEYFLQFLSASLLMGAKWIIDSKTTKMLIMVHEAWKRGDKETTDKVFSRFDLKKHV
jgi:hypothetical protein